MELRRHIPVATSEQVELDLRDEGWRRSLRERLCVP
jgi:hypothetical protein